MGMAASQVRFLTLQNRKSSVGLQLGTLASRKRSLNREMTQLATDYNASFSQTKLQWFDDINDKYTDITYANMMTPGLYNNYSPYLLTDRATGSVILDSVNPTTSTPLNGHSGADASMSKHMELLTGYTGENYVPGSQTLTQDMEFYIIENIIGVNPFNRYKMRYDGVDNTTVTEPDIVVTSGGDFMKDSLGVSTIGETVKGAMGTFFYSNGDGNHNSDLKSETLWATLYENDACVSIGSWNLIDDARTNTATKLNTITGEYIDKVFSFNNIKNMNTVAELDATGLSDLKNKIKEAALNAITSVYDDNSNMFTDNKQNVDTLIQDNSEGKFFSNQPDDPLQSSANKEIGYEQAAVKQANATVCPVAISYDNNWQCFISVANLMDVVMYYVGLYTAEEPKEDEVYTQDAAAAAVNGSHTSDTAFMPSSYANRAKLNLKETGETNAASMYSIYSNACMLEELLAHRDLYDNAFGNDYAQWAGQNDSNLDVIGYIKSYVSSFINGDSNVQTSDLIPLANINAWLCEALSAENSSDFTNAITNAKSMYDLRGEDMTVESNWNTQMAAHPNAFWYDSGRTFNKRTIKFRQDFDAISASSSCDIGSQLNASEQNQLKFYKKLVKACLEAGWQDNSSVGDSEYLNAVLANTKWLIDGLAAKDSSRIYEVKNKEAREEALADYEAKHEIVSQKSERVDMQMQSLKTEQTAINTEMESIKKVISDNIESTFSFKG